MQTDQIKYSGNPNAAALDVWDNEGGAPERGNFGHLFGRRIESNGSWTTYHVFTGVPVRVGNLRMVGLSKAEATSAMLTGNAEIAKRRNVAVVPAIFARLP